MKKSILILCVSFLLMNCSSESSKQSILTGTWKFIEISQQNEDLSGGFVVVPQEYQFSFIINPNGVANTDLYPCSGIIEKNENLLTLNMECNLRDLNPYYYLGNDTHPFTIQGNILIIDPSQCDEGCRIKFEKQNDLQ